MANHPTTIDTTDLATGLAQVRALREADREDRCFRTSYDFACAAPAMADLLERYAARLAEVEAERDRVAAENQRLRAALAHAEDWADQIAHDERVTGWVHGADYSLYLLLADCPVDLTGAEETDGGDDV